MKTSLDEFSREDVTDLIEQAGGARVVMIGEASHGTDEFYQIRAEARIVPH